METVPQEANENKTSGERCDFSRVSLCGQDVLSIYEAGGTFDDVLVYTTLLYHRNRKTGLAWPGQKRIASLLSQSRAISRQRVNRAVGRLVKAGLIADHPKRKNRVRVLRFPMVEAREGDTSVTETSHKHKNEADNSVTELVQDNSVTELVHKPVLNRILNRNIPPIVPQEGDAPPQQSENHTQDVLVLRDEVLSAWNAMAETCGLPKARHLKGKRLRQLKARYRDPDWRAHWREALALIPGRGFLLGRNDGQWKANLTWFLREESVTNILDGQYQSKTRQDDWTRAGRDPGDEGRFSDVRYAKPSQR